MDKVTESEKQARSYAVASAVGTHLLEDLPPDAETRAIMQKYVDGELSLAQFSDAMDRHAQHLAQATSLIPA